MKKCKLVIKSVQGTVLATIEEADLSTPLILTLQVETDDKKKFEDIRMYRITNNNKQVLQ